MYSLIIFLVLSENQSFQKMRFFKSLLFISVLFCSAKIFAQQKTPIYQSELGNKEVTKHDLTLLETSYNERWLGQGVRNVRWSPDGNSVYFQWTTDPINNPYTELNPWFRVDAGGKSVIELKPDKTNNIPGDNIIWNEKEGIAAWSKNGNIFLYNSKQDPATRLLIAIDNPIVSIRFHGSSIHFITDGNLFSVDSKSGLLTQLISFTIKEENEDSAINKWLTQQQLDLYYRFQNEENKRKTLNSLNNQQKSTQKISIPKGFELIDAQLSPNKDFLTFIINKPNLDKNRTSYIDFVDVSDYATVNTARAKVGEAFDDQKFGIVEFNPTA